MTSAVCRRTCSCKNALQPAEPCLYAVLAVHRACYVRNLLASSHHTLLSTWSTRSKWQSSTIYCQSEDVNKQYNFKTAAIAQISNTKWAVSPAREYLPKAKQVAAANTDKEFTKPSAIMIVNRLVRLSIIHKVAAVPSAAGWVRRTLVTPRIRESSDHLRSFTGSQYH